MQTQLSVVDEEVFTDIQADFRNHSFEYLREKYHWVDSDIIRKVLGSHDYQEFWKWVSGKAL